MAPASRFFKSILLVQMLATLLVIIGHSYPFASYIPEWLTISRLFIYSFHMPLCVFISGYLLVLSEQSRKQSFGSFARKRFLKLLVPYVVLSVIALAPKYAFQTYLNDTLSLDFNSIIRSFFVPRENIWGHFWFLPMIFLLGIFGFALNKALDSLRIHMSLGWALTLIFLFGVYFFSFRRKLCGWFSVDDICAFGWLYATGALAATYNIIEKLPNVKMLLQITASFLAAVIIFAIPTVGEAMGLLSVKYAIIALLMVYAMLQLGRYLSEKITIAASAAYSQTFLIFLLSWPFQAIANIVMERILFWPYFVVMPLQFASGIITPILSIIMIDIIERNLNIRWVSLILGK